MPCQELSRNCNNFYLELGYPRYFEYGFKLGVGLQRRSTFGDWEFAEVYGAEDEIDYLKTK